MTTRNSNDSQTESGFIRSAFIASAILAMILGLNLPADAQEELHMRGAQALGGPVTPTSSASRSAGDIAASEVEARRPDQGNPPPVLPTEGRCARHL